MVAYSTTQLEADVAPRTSMAILVREIRQLRAQNAALTDRLALMQTASENADRDATQPPRWTPHNHFNQPATTAGRDHEGERP